MISFNLEVFPKKVRMLGIHFMQNNKHFFFICAFSQVFLKKLFTSKGQGFSFFPKNYTNAFP
jgi:hypothetical protein